MRVSIRRGVVLSGLVIVVGCGSKGGTPEPGAAAPCKTATDCLPTPDCKGDAACVAGQCQYSGSGQEGMVCSSTTVASGLCEAGNCVGIPCSGTGACPDQNGGCITGTCNDSLCDWSYWSTKSCTTASGTAGYCILGACAGVQGECSTDSDCPGCNFCFMISASVGKCEALLPSNCPANFPKTCVLTNLAGAPAQICAVCGSGQANCAEGCSLDDTNPFYDCNGTLTCKTDCK